MSSINIPAIYSEIVSEILCFTSFPQEEVEPRVWMQAIEPGWNVLQDVQRFGVTPHKYDDHMLQLYQDGDGFIFESLVFWGKPFRQEWTSLALDRLDLYSREWGMPADQRLPTHLKTNTRYMGMTPFLFSQHGMQLTWLKGADLFKLYEYHKKKDIGFKDRSLLIRDANIRGLYFSRYRAKIIKTWVNLPMPDGEHG